MRLLALLGALALAGALAVPASADPPHSMTPSAKAAAPTFAWTFTNNRVVQQIVEQQSPDYFFNGGSAGGAWFCTHYADGSTHPDTCVHNPTACPWSADDNWVNGSYGVLEPGASSFTDCLIADNTYNGPPLTHITGTHVLGLQLIADTPDLVVTVTYQPQNVTFTFTPRLVNRRYVYQGCILGPIPDSDQVQPITGSNGGYGVQESITVLTANGTGHKWQKTQANIFLQLDAPYEEAVGYCRGTLGPIGTGYRQNGAIWQTGL